jgi:hypothetical protein
MEQPDSRQEKLRLSDEKKPYEPPKATFVPAKLEERVMQCDFNSYRVCGPNR